MTIRNPAAHAAATTEWGPLAPALKPGTSVIDIDGSHDCNGHVLILETKHAGFSWSEDSLGQWRHLATLAASFSRTSKGRAPVWEPVYSPFTVWVLYLADQSDVRTVVGYSVVDPDESWPEFRARKATPCDFQALLDLLSAWTAARV